jgi:hypothetical protein
MKQPDYPREGEPRDSGSRIVLGCGLLFLVVCVAVVVGVVWLWKSISFPTGHGFTLPSFSSLDEVLRW